MEYNPFQYEIKLRPTKKRKKKTYRLRVGNLPNQMTPNLVPTLLSSFPLFLIMTYSSPNLPCD